LSRPSPLSKRRQAAWDRRWELAKNPAAVFLSVG
jgi:hypothetical protein